MKQKRAKITLLMKTKKNQWKLTHLAVAASQMMSKLIMTTKISIQLIKKIWIKKENQLRLI